jgi:hypothetical protein
MDNWRNLDESVLNDLSVYLLYYGFYPVLGTMERKRGELEVVRLGNPRTYDKNMGVVCVYDENGRPWVLKNEMLGLYVSQEARWGNLLEDVLLEKFTLARGAYVPHSNDGGYFLGELMPGLHGPGERYPDQ